MQRIVTLPEGKAAALARRQQMVAEFAPVPVDYGRTQHKFGNESRIA